MMNFCQYFTLFKKGFATWFQFILLLMIVLLHIFYYSCYYKMFIIYASVKNFIFHICNIIFRLYKYWIFVKFWLLNTFICYFKIVFSYIRYFQFKLKVLTVMIMYYYKYRYFHIFHILNGCINKYSYFKDLILEL